MNRPTPQEDQTPLRCMFCGENAVTTEPRGLVFVARCGFCGARGQVHYTEDEARAEWTALGRAAEIAHLAVRMREAELAYQTASECIGLAACDACYAAAYDALVAALDAADDA